MSWESILKAPIQTTTEELQRVGLKPAQIKELERPVLQPKNRRKVKRKKPSEEWDEETQGPEDNPWTEKEKATQARIDAEKGKNLTAAQRVQNARDRNKKGSVFVDGKFKPFSSKRGKKEGRFVEDSEGNVVDRSEKPLTLKPQGKGPLSHLKPTPKRRVPTGEEGFLGRQKTKLQEQVDGEWKDKETFAQKEGERWKNVLDRGVEGAKGAYDWGAKRRKELSESQSPGLKIEEARHAAQAEGRKERDIVSERRRQEASGGRQARSIEDKIQRDADKAAEVEQQRIADEARAKRRSENIAAIEAQKEGQRRAIAVGTSKPGVRTGTVTNNRSRIIKPTKPTTSQGSGKPMIEQYNEQTERNTEATKEATTALTNAAKNLGNVNKMNNDKYNVKQKGEKNRNLTPFVMPQGKRPAPKTSDIPGVVQHPKRKQKKTENKW
tara:strand:+ start:4602 stop:5915 length:1314 start_codon:yes stop_codon:yes gene_type:complete